MRKLHVQKITKETLCDKWQIRGNLIKDGEELFVRSDKGGRINWDKTILYFWNDLEKIKNERKVVFTLPPYPEYLKGLNQSPKPKAMKTTYILFNTNFNAPHTGMVHMENELLLTAKQAAKINRSLVNQELALEYRACPVESTFGKSENAIGSIRGDGMVAIIYEDRGTINDKP